MDVFEAIETRRSIRRYRDEPVPRDILDKILEAARIAPSSSNVQSWKFKVVTDAATRKQLRELAFGQKLVEEAPVVIACCIDFKAFNQRARRCLEFMNQGEVRPNVEKLIYSMGEIGDEEFDLERMLITGIMNVTIAVTNMVLTATTFGLGSCWMRAFDSTAVERLLDIPEGLSVLTLIPLGYPDESPSPRPRKSIEEILI